MAIVVETGSGTDQNANSYVSESELTEYTTDRGITLTGTASVLLIKAMDYLETLTYRGNRTLETQPLSWPREEVFLDSIELDKNTIPTQLKRAQMTLAVELDSGNDPLSSLDQAVKREQAGPVEVEYMDNSYSGTILRSVDAQLRDLILNSGGFGNIHVGRG